MADDITFTLEQPITLRNGQEILLRAARPDDAADLLVIAEQVIHEGISMVNDKLDTLEERTEELTKTREGNLYLVAEHEGKVVGALELYSHRPALLQHQRSLSIELHRDYRGGGLGAAMMNHAAAWARAQEGIDFITLGVLDSNPRAKAFYERLGYRVYGHLPNFVKRRDGVYVGDTQMVLVL
jgi:ribosomal protein S18 acetylase RimI-like enzyme